ncbi:MAG: hypothetical protein HYS98_01020 [Deltaproteobacteria bacterium]|nr:hypothetical protein [Deltaproteobacteria bacterium]
MNVRIKLISIFLILSFAMPIKAFDFGATAALVAKLISQHVQELIKLEKIINQGKDAYRLANDVYRGIHETLHILKSLEDTLDPGTFHQLKNNIEKIIHRVARIYGKIPNTARKESLILHDQIVVDTIARHNQIYEDHEEMEQERKWLEQEILARPSPGRSQQLSVGVEYEILKALSRIEKNQAAALKVLATHLGMTNELEKKRSQEVQEQYESLDNAFDSLNFRTSLATVEK